MKQMISLSIAAVVLMLASITSAQALINGIFLGSDKDGANILNDRLRPGQEYSFPVLVAADGTPPVQLTSADLNRNRLDVRVVSGGAAIRSVEVEEQEGLAYITIVAGSRGTTKELEAKLRINYKSRDSKDNVTVTPVVRVGYNPMSDDVVAALDPDEPLELDNQFPVISSRQWDALSRLNEHRAVTLKGNDWQYEVHVTGLGKRNLVYDHQPAAELVKNFPDQQLHFLAFPGEPDFEVAGKLTIDVFSLAEDFGDDFHLYRSAYGKLYPLKFDYDREAATITFRPSQLSTYLLTDKKIQLKDNEPVIGGGSASDSSEPDTAPSMPNPDTGNGAGSIAAWVVSMVSLAGLGAIRCGNRKR